MKVVHLWRGYTRTEGGGGGLAMYELHRGLRLRGVDSRVVCDIKTDNDEGVGLAPRWRADTQLARATTRVGLNDIHRLSSFAVPEHELVSDATVAHVHGTHTGFFNYLALPRLGRAKPLVFTLHDMWALTGHCAQSHGCMRWQTGCGRCPSLDIHPATRREATRLEWRLKRFAFLRANPWLVVPSRWLENLVEQSALASLPRSRIPIGVDTDALRPIDRRAARRRLDVPPDANVILFVAQTLSDPAKGIDLLAAALSQLCDRDVVVLLMGDGGDAIAERLPVPSIALGYVADPREKATAYSAADVFVSPTRADNFPLVLMEASSCGTPSVAFDVGGVSDIVVDGTTGLLAPAGDAARLGAHIADLLAAPERRRAMSVAARDRAISHLSLAREVERYLELYQAMAEAQEARPA